MKKGELKKQEILKTAEAMFCRVGYEATSVQDILDVLHTSKGSFYHHFVSKEALLEEICRNRVSSSSGRMSEILSSGDLPVEKMNRLLSDMIPLSGEKLSFIMMILPVFMLPEGLSLRSFYAKEISSVYYEAVFSVIMEGVQQKAFHCRDIGFYTQMCLRIGNDLWIDICDRIIADEQAGNTADPTEILSMVCQYRTVLEKLLSAPFGSLEILNITDLINLTEQIHQHWKK